MKRVLITALLLCLTTAAAFAQDEYISDEGTQNTGGLWTELGATKVLPYNLSVGLDAGFRTNEWFDEANRFDISLGMDWKPTKHWKFGVSYTFLMKHYPELTEYKNSSEYKYNYRNTSDGTDQSFKTFPGATYDDETETATYTDPDGNTYRYQGYSDINKNYTRVTDAYWRAKHRISVDAAYTQRFWKTLRITLRERYQLTFVPAKDVNRNRDGFKSTVDYIGPDYSDLSTSDFEALATGDMDAWKKIRYDDSELSAEIPEDSTKTKKSKTQHVLRSRLSFEIDKKGWAWTPYIYIESFNNLGEGFHFDKLRFSGGVEYALSKQHKLSLGYIFNHENDDDGEMNIHAINIGYKFKF